MVTIQLQFVDNKMKISRQKLRQLICEAMYDLTTLPPKEQGIPTSMIGISDPSRREKLAAISQSPDGGYQQAAELIDTFGGTPAVIGMEGGYEAAAERGEKLRDLEFFRPLIEKVPKEVDAFGFDYYKDVFNRSSDYEGMGPIYRFQAKVLGCEVDDLAYIEVGANMPGDRGYDTYYDMGKILKKLGIQPVPITGLPNNYGYNQLYTIPKDPKNGLEEDLKILHTDFYLDGYTTYTVCG